MTERPVFRFAPSPNGRLHLGHALSALYGFDMAQRLGGRFLLRIEDIDVSRARPEFVQGIFEDLAWLGIAWEKPVLVQSKNFAVYAAAAEQLQTMGLLYPCFASRAEIEAASDPQHLDPEGAPLYPGLWRDRASDDVARAKASGVPYAMRLDMRKALPRVREKLDGTPLQFRDIDGHGEVRVVRAQPERWGDVVILRKDVPASYLLSVVVDDARQGVSHVTRGTDLFAATDLQRLLQVLLDLPEPLYSHHRLMVLPNGRKLSKSHGDTSLAELRQTGITPLDIRRMVGLAGHF